MFVLQAPENRVHGEGDKGKHKVVDVEVDMHSPISGTISHALSSIQTFDVGVDLYITGRAVSGNLYPSSVDKVASPTLYLFRETILDQPRHCCLLSLLLLLF